MRILFFGDIFGRPGRDACVRALPGLKVKYRPDIVICNGENLAHGAGATESVVNEMFSAGVDIVTSGNHIFDKPNIADFMARDKRLIRPLNFEAGSPGEGFSIIEKNGKKAMVLNLIGQLFFKRQYQNAFLVVEEFLQTVPSDVKIVLVDFHADATSEKKAMGLFLDGKVSAVLGTHTHIPTADEQVLSAGTGYLTDIGMTGIAHSVIGMDAQLAIDAFKGKKVKMDVAEGSTAEVNAVFLDVDDETGKTRTIERIRLFTDVQSA